METPSADLTTVCGCPRVALLLNLSLLRMDGHEVAIQENVLQKMHLADTTFTTNELKSKVTLKQNRCVPCTRICIATH